MRIASSEMLAQATAVMRPAKYALVFNLDAMLTSRIAPSAPNISGSATTAAATTAAATTAAATTAAATTAAATTAAATTAAATTAAGGGGAAATTAAGGADTTAAGGAPETTAATVTRKPWPKPNCGAHTLTNGLRTLFLNTHNQLRGLLARGQTQTSAGWGIAPPAALMYRMKYSCNAESYAIQYVSSCQPRVLPEYTHPGHKVNTHVLRTVQTTEAGAIQNAMATWWGQLARFGMRSNMMFYGSENRRGNRNVLKWAKMAWWNNKEIGCAVRKCGTFFYTACMYSPGGNRVNQHVYKVGAVCSDCPKGECDGQALCRW
ncbi:hypothetical protein Y032_0008g207 [Ancylostoma ceylanicum]|uniref:SCP domain-containing protein n=2 Tax=Ancylostoma ceylanicum TaxID=53326 RepID=A0A016VM32_9BILA|nr:hypothetical protein Y032_0008g207 [Ancylostoma ceylanicum]